MLVASEVEEKSSWFSERWMVMWRLQRIILFIFCSFVFSTSVASAQLVQLSDLGAEQFYQGLEIIAGYDCARLHRRGDMGRHDSRRPRTDEPRFPPSRPAEDSWPADRAERAGRRLDYV